MKCKVINTVLSYDENASAPMAAMFGFHHGLSISDIPFDGPIAGVPKWAMWAN